MKLEQQLLNISKECAEHFYPDSVASESELVFERLSIDELTAPFMTLIYMSVLSMVGLIVEIIFFKISKQLNKNTHDVVDPVETSHYVGFTVRLTDGSIEQMIFLEQFEIFLDNFDISIMFVKQKQR